MFLVLQGLMLFSDDLVFFLMETYFTNYKKMNSSDCKTNLEGQDRILQWGIYTFLILENFLINLVIILKMMEWMKAISIIKREKDIDRETLLSKEEERERFLDKPEYNDIKC